MDETEQGIRDAYEAQTVLALALVLRDEFPTTEDDRLGLARTERILSDLLNRQALKLIPVDEDGLPADHSCEDNCDSDEHHRETYDCISLLRSYGYDVKDAYDEDY